MKSSFDWSNATSPERRDLIFENRNKEYGGYVIRRDYQRNIIFAMLFTFFGTAILVSIPRIISCFSELEMEKAKPITEGIILETFPQIVRPAPIIPTVTPPPLLAKTTKFTTPIIVDKVPAEDFLSQELSRNQNIGASNQNGNQIIDLPSEPVDNVFPDTPVLFAHEMPIFPGGENKLFEYLSKIKYPPIARENNISGRVYVSFVVDKEGKIKEVKLLRGIGGGCDEEAIRVIKSMPVWKPGLQNGEPVSVLYNLAVNFNLK